MKNQEIRMLVKQTSVRMWQVAEELGMQDSAFSRKLRWELPAEEKEKILQIIQKLSEEKENG